MSLINHKHRAKSSTRKQLGQLGEQIAQTYLLQQGLTLLQPNYRCRMGEIDLVMWDKKSQHTVFIEVRYRKDYTYGGAIASITQQKQQKIIKTALYYLQAHSTTALNCRFDVLILSGDITQPQINWIANAFTYEAVSKIAYCF